MDRFWSKVEKTDTCWNWTSAKHPKGYGLFWSGGMTRKAHRISYEMHCGLIPDGMHVLHRCDNRCCVNPDHLFVGTNSDNMKDKVSKGRQARKLSREEVLEIRSASGVYQYVLAEKYGVDQGQISRIQSRKAYAHIADMEIR